MKKIRITLLLSILANLLFAQKNGLVINNQTNEPIPYVNIHLLGTNKGFTSDKCGKFEIKATNTDTIVFSALGFKTEYKSYSSIQENIALNPTIFEIPEVIVTAQKRRTTKVGELKRQFPSFHIGTSSNYSYMVAQFFPYNKNYDSTPFIKSIEFLTYSDIKKAKFNIRLYKADTEGKPNTIIHDKNIIVVARKGSRKSSIDLERLHIQYPKNGLFIAIEWLNIEENKHEYSYTMKGSKKKHKAISIEPSFSARKDINDENRWVYYGSWLNVKNKPIQMEITLVN